MTITFSLDSLNLLIIVLCSLCASLSHSIARFNCFGSARNTVYKTFFDFYYGNGSINQMIQKFILMGLPDGPSSVDASAGKTISVKVETLEKKFRVKLLRLILKAFE